MPAPPAAPEGALSRLEAWGSDLAGDQRTFLYSAVGGAAFGIIMYGTMATALGIRLNEALATTQGMTAAAGSILLLSIFWTLVGTFAYAGWSRIFLATAMGHLVGYVLMSVNLALSTMFAMDGALAFVSLFGFTFLGFVAGAVLELLVHYRRLRTHMATETTPTNE